jgi:hypothetical protein
VRAALVVAGLANLLFLLLLGFRHQGGHCDRVPAVVAMGALLGCLGCMALTLAMAVELDARKVPDAWAPVAALLPIVIVPVAWCVREML